MRRRGVPSCRRTNGADRITGDRTGVAERARAAALGLVLLLWAITRFGKRRRLGTTAEPPHTGDAEQMRAARSSGSYAESQLSGRGVSAVLALQGFLIAVWWTHAPDPGLVRVPLAVWSNPSAHDVKVALTLIGLLSVVSGAALLLEAERCADRARLARVGRTCPRRTPWWPWLLGFSALIMALGSGLCLVWFVVAPGPQSGHWLMGFVAAGAVAGAAVAPRAALRTVVYQPVTTHTSAPAWADRPDTVLALSGGGIRSAAFALGACNALQRSGRAEPHIVAISGGSYTAAALALFRRWWTDRPDIPGVDEPQTRPAHVEKHDPPVPWPAAYRPGSPELARLRRHTRDLVEPGWYLMQGVVALLLGAAVNLLVVVATILFAAWTLGWLYAVTHTLVITGTDRISIALDVPALRLWSWPGWAVAVGVLVLFTGVIWILHGRADGQLSPPPTRPNSDEKRRWDPERLAGGRLVFTLVVVGLFVVLTVLPAALSGLTRLALDNAPNATTASIVTSMGLTTEKLCRDAVLTDMSEDYEAATKANDLDPGQKRTLKGAACGSSYEVVVAAVPAEEPREAIAASVAAQRRAADETAGDGGGLTATLTTLTALLAAVGAAVKFAGTTGDVQAASGWRRQLRRLLLQWVPLAAVIGTGVWLLARWTFRLTLEQQVRNTLWPALIVLAAILATVVCSANLTSLHGYYRRRLSSAFAAGRAAPDAEAAARDDCAAAGLPYADVYRFSDLRLPLHIVTTANVHAYGETPTRRGGLPFTFSSSDTTVVTMDGVVGRDVTCYENAAGAGRTSVMSVVAMSGAAVSPLAGRYAARLAPFRMLLTLFNVRVGVWVLNPTWTGPDDVPGDGARRWHCWPAEPAFTNRPGSAQILREAVGRSSIRDRWLYLSDGGHLDNTGLVEAVRLLDGPAGAAGHVIAVDASNDASGTWAAVGDALAVIRADLDIDLRRSDGGPAPVGSQKDEARTPAPGRKRLLGAAAPAEPPPDHVRHYQGEESDDGLWVTVVKAVLNPSLTDLPEPVAAFVRTHPDFPRASTTRQDFGDVEFEAYRALGEAYTAEALRQEPELRRKRKQKKRRG